MEGNNVCVSVCVDICLDALKNTHNFDNLEESFLQRGKGEEAFEHPQNML